MQKPLVLRSGPARSTPSLASRRRFLGGALATGGATALALSQVVPVFAALNTDPLVDFAMAAVGAERIGIAFYGNALGVGSPYSCASDVAKGTILNSGHREYFQAAMNQETQHLATLQGFLGKQGTDAFPYTTFRFPSGTFTTAPAMLSFGEQLESIFIGAYLGAVKAGAATGTTLGTAVAELAAQIAGIECEHRVLIRDINGQDPPNDRFFEGDQTPGLSGMLGNTGTRSVVYATGDAAVTALVNLGIVPGNGCS